MAKNNLINEYNFSFNDLKNNLKNTFTTLKHDKSTISNSSFIDLNIINNNLTTHLGCAKETIIISVDLPYQITDYNLYDNKSYSKQLNIFEIKKDNTKLYIVNRITENILPQVYNLSINLIDIDKNSYSYPIIIKIIENNSINIEYDSIYIDTLNNNQIYTDEQPLLTLKSNTVNAHYNSIGLPIGLHLNSSTGKVTGKLDINVKHFNSLFTVTKKYNGLTYSEHLRINKTIKNNNNNQNDSIELVTNSDHLKIDKKKDNENVPINSVRNLENIKITTDVPKIMEQYNEFTENNIINDTEIKSIINNDLHSSIKKHQNINQILGVWDIFWEIDNINNKSIICRCVLKLNELNLRNSNDVHNIAGPNYGGKNWPPLWLTCSDFGTNLEQLKDNLVKSWPKNLYDYGIYDFQFKDSIYEFKLFMPSKNIVKTDKYFYDISINENNITGKIIDNSYPESNGVKYRKFYGKKIIDHSERKKLTVFSYLRPFKL